jgi:DNA-binding CsgD family transcriptional regulator
VSDLEQTPILIGDIYDAALDPSQWSAVLQRAADFVGGAAASLYFKDAGTRTGDVYFYGGEIDPSYTDLYFDEYLKLDPLTTGHVLAEVEQTTCLRDIMAPDEFARTRIYQEWVRPQGWVDCANAVLDKSAASAALFGVFREERHGPVDDDARSRMRQIVPHIRRALLIGRAIEVKTAEAATFADTLDGLAAGMFLVDDTGRIVHANVSGYAMAAEGSALRSQGGRLAPTNVEAAQALSEIFTAAAGGDAAVGTKGIALPFAGRDGKCYAAHVLPLTSGERRRAGANHAAVAAVFLREATVEAPSLPETFARHFGLTPTELRVLLAIVQVGGVPEAAEALGIAVATVKTHLHRLFGKTRSSRQVDLVKLVAGFSNPLVN